MTGNSQPESLDGLRTRGPWLPRLSIRGVRVGVSLHRIVGQVEGPDAGPGRTGKGSREAEAVELGDRRDCGRWKCPPTLWGPDILRKPAGYGSNRG